jgi:Asp-tRNA(Asn)/Glu-tRNA(Gln) amidotransferase A subunit family amidase
LKSLAESLDTIGVMARTVEDCALLVHAVSGRALPDFSAPRAPRIGFHRTSRWQDASGATHTALENAAAALARAGATVRDFALPEHFDGLYDEQELIMNFEGARAFADERFRNPELLSDHLRGTLQAHWDMPRSRYDDAMRHARECRAVFASLFTDIDVLLTPSAPGEAPKGIESTGSSLFNRNWTLLGAPCVTVPYGRGPQGLPLGVQLVAPYDEDARVLLAAEWVRQALG